MGPDDGAYEGRTGGEYDRLIDTVAAVWAGARTAAVVALYDSEDLSVPADLVR